MTAATAAGTVAEALAPATEAIAAAGCDSPRLDAELLLAEALGRDRAWLAAHPNDGVEAVHGRRFGEMVRRRVRREPVAYILGRKGFRGIDVEVDPRVLVPRPETELLVELAVELQPAELLDVGTGSGAIALAVASELPDTAVTATDTSTAALEVARANAAALGLADRVGFETGSLPGAGRFDLLLANLPYVRDDEWDWLAPEITRYEPREALVAGPSGLEAIELLLAALLAGPVGVEAIGLEVGAGQAPLVSRLVSRAGFGRVETRPDLAGIDRIVAGTR